MSSKERKANPKKKKLKNKNNKWEISPTGVKVRTHTIVCPIAGCLFGVKYEYLHKRTGPCGPGVWEQVLLCLNEHTKEHPGAKFGFQQKPTAEDFKG